MGTDLKKERIKVDELGLKGKNAEKIHDYVTTGKK